MIAVVPLNRVVVAVDMIGNGSTTNHQSLKRGNIKEETEMMILLTKRVRREDLVIQNTVVNDTKEMNISERRKIKDLDMIEVVAVQMMIIADIHQRRNGSMISRIGWYPPFPNPVCLFYERRIKKKL